MKKEKKSKEVVPVCGPMPSDDRRGGIGGFVGAVGDAYSVLNTN